MRTLRSLLIIEDAAQPMGPEYQGKRAANLGGIGYFSFYPTKNLDTYFDQQRRVVQSCASFLRQGTRRAA
jgi:dTDP-4-amino-4,6-dideoxygalactose transaminase